MPRVATDMRAWLVLLAACSGSTPEPRQPPLPTTVAPPTIARPPARLAPTTRVLRPSQVGGHGNTIVLTAITDDGATAATVDLSHLIRLWPTLDGKREPVVVTGPAPIAIAVAHDASTADPGFAIAILDAGGTIHVERLTHDGAQYPELAIDAPLPFEQLETMKHGFVALRADDRVELIDPDGAHRTVAPPPARISRLLARNANIVAIVAGRAHVLVDGRWGPPSAALPLALDLAHAALSPDGLRIAVATSAGVARFEIATGKITVTGQPGELPLGYTDATTLLTSNAGALTWHVGDHPAGEGNQSNPITDTNTAIGDGRVITALGVQLALPLPFPGNATQYLGYDVIDPSPLRTTSLGLLARMDRPAVIDAQLVPRGLFTKGHEADWMDFTTLDDRFGVALVRDFTEDMERRWCEVIELATGKRVQKLDADARFDTLAWEPSTQLFATLSAQGAALYHYESGRLVPLGALPGAPDRVFLLDPALADGDLAIAIESTQVTRIGADRKRHGKPAQITNAILTIDRSGRIFSRKEVGKEASLLVGDLEVPGYGRATIRVSPDLKRIAAFTGQSAALIDRDGRVRWTVVSWGTRDLGWTADNELISATGGLLRLDLATGRPIAKRCGWAFGLTAAQHAAVPTGLSTCDD